MPLRDMDQGAGGAAGPDGESRQILRGGLISLGGILIKSGGRVPFIVLAAALFSTAAIGRFAAATVVIQIAGALAVFGMRRSLYGELNRLPPEDAPRLLASGLALAVALAVILAMAIAGVTSTLLPGSLLPPEALWLLALVPAIAASEVFLVATRHYGVLRYHVLARNVAEPWMLAVLTGVAGLVLPDAHGLMLAYAGATLSAFLVTVFGFRRCLVGQGLRLASPSGRIAFDLLRHTAPTAFVDFFENMSRRLDVYILSLFAPSGAVGLYYLARQVALLVQNVKQVLDPVVDPMIARLTVKGGMAGAKAQVHLVTRWIFTVQTAFLVTLLVPASALLALLGESLAGGAATLGLLMLGELVVGTTSPLELPILVLRRWLNAAGSLGAMVIYLVACIALSRAYGAPGAAGGFALGLGALALFRIGTVGWTFAVMPFDSAMAKPALAGGAAAAAGLLVLGMSASAGPAAGFSVTAAATLAAYVLALRMLGFEPADRELFAALRRRAKPLPPASGG